jgi:hypothetical protein
MIPESDCRNCHTENKPYLKLCVECGDHLSNAKIKRTTKFNDGSEELTEFFSSLTDNPKKEAEHLNSVFGQRFFYEVVYG